MLCLSYRGLLRQGVDLPSGDYSAEFKQRFADGYADGATIAMLQHEFGLAKSPRREYPLSALLESIGMPCSAYCRHEAGPPSGRQATERPAIAGICEKSRFGYGYRRVADTLRKAAGIRIADKTARKAVREEGPLLRARRRRRRRFRMGRAGKSPPDLPARDFGAEGPMAKPATDVAESRAGGAKPRLSPAVDPCSDEVVAYSISGSPSMETAPGMPAGLEGGLDGGDAPPPHSDMGRQHRVPACRLALERTGIARSTSRKGNRLDNAKAENFFSTAKTEPCCDWEGRPRRLRGGFEEAYRPV